MKVEVTVSFGKEEKELISGLIGSLGALTGGSPKETKETAKKPATAQATEEEEAKGWKAPHLKPKAKAVAEEVEEVEDAPAPKVAPKAKGLPAKKTPAPAEEVEDAPAPAPKVAPKANPIPKATPAPKAKAVAKDATREEFAELDADDQVEMIKKVVTRNTKKGKSADVKMILSLYEVSKATDLTEESFEHFYDLILRYSDGETAEDIVSEFV